MRERGPTVVCAHTVFCLRPKARDKPNAYFAIAALRSREQERRFCLKQS